MSDDCTRRRVEIGGQNYYLVVGDDFVFATVPAENRPDNLQERIVVETLCAHITELMAARKGAVVE